MILAALLLIAARGQASPFAERTLQPEEWDREANNSLSQ